MPKTPTIKYKSLTSWELGVNSKQDNDRTQEKALKTTENVQLEQDGTVGPRPGLKLYGVQPVGTVLGQIYEYVKMNGTVAETWLIWMENRSGTGTVVIAKDGGTATVVTGKTYSSTAKAHFEQIYGKVLITNGFDNLSYMDIQTSVITPFTSLATPTGVTATPTAALVGSNVTLRYRAAAANQGETVASTASVITVIKQRGLWNGTTESVTVTGTIPTGTSRVNLYLGDQAGFEYFLDSISVSTVATTFSYVDPGSVATNNTRVAPVGDSTSGPKTTRGTNVKGQVYMVGDSDNPGRIWFGGNGQSALDFSSYNGGGWVEPNKGGKDFPAKVVPFRDGKGTPMAACLSKGTNGTGKRYLLQPSTTTVGSTLLTYMAVQEDNGQDGTDSPDGVVMLDDALWYPSRQAFKTTTTKASIQNILSTQGISDNIAPDVTALSSLYMANCVGLANDRRIYWTLPYQSTTNNQIWVLDLRQKGAWIRPWYVNSDWLTLYADNTTGATKVLTLTNNKIYELDPATSTNDDGTPFLTNIGSGNIKFSDDGYLWGSVLDVTFVFLRPQGTINISVSAQTEDDLITLSSTVDTTSLQSVSGWGRYGWGAVGWGNIPVGTSFIGVAASKSRVSKKIDIDEEVNWLTFGVNSVDPGVSFQLADVIVSYVPTGRKETDN